MKRPVAAAIGAGIDIAKPCGNMIVDIGGGTADIAVISLGGTVVNTSIKVAGDDFDEAIVRYMRKKHNLLIGERTAEDIKIKIGTTYPLIEEESMEVRGRNLGNRSSKDGNSHVIGDRRGPAGDYRSDRGSSHQCSGAHTSGTVRGYPGPGDHADRRRIYAPRAGRADRGEDRNQYHDSGRTDAGGGYRNRTVCRICRRAKRLLMEEIKGYVEHIVYRNEDNGYTVFHLNNEDGEVTCVGNFSLH